MNKTYKIEAKNGIICVRFKQNPSALDICNSLDDVAKLKHGEFRLWDFTCGVDLSRDVVEKAATYARSIHMPSGKVAIIAPQDLTFGLFRMFATYREEEDIDLNVFRTEIEAVAWLNDIECPDL
jgi:hypothetical protein